MRAKSPEMLLKCPTCRESFAPNYWQAKIELLVICPHCFTPYIPQAGDSPALRIVQTDP